jgi:ribosomal protein L29
MKRNEIIDLRSKTHDELMRIAEDLRVEIDKQKTEEVLGKLKNLNLVRSKRKDLARVLTFLHMKNLANDSSDQRTESVKEEVS